MCTFINPFIICNEVHHFDQVGENKQVFTNQVIVLPNKKNKSYSFYPQGGKTGPAYQTLTHCAEFLDCRICDGETLEPVSELPDNSYPLYKEVKVYTSLTKTPYRIWTDVRINEDDNVIEIRSKDGSHINAFYTKNIDGGAFLAIKTK